MKDFIDKNKLIHSSQYGFRRAHSPDHAILDIVETLQNNVDKHYFSCGVFTDLKKAFNTLNHKILLDKLKNKSLKESNILGNENFQPPFKFCMQLGTQGGCTKMPFLKVAALLLPW